MFRFFLSAAADWGLGYSVECIVELNFFKPQSPRRTQRVIANSPAFQRRECVARIRLPIPGISQI